MTHRTKFRRLLAFKAICELVLPNLPQVVSILQMSVGLNISEYKNYPKTLSKIQIPGPLSSKFYPCRSGVGPEICIFNLYPR